MIQQPRSGTDINKGGQVGCEGGADCLVARRMRPSPRSDDDDDHRRRMPSPRSFRPPPRRQPPPPTALPSLLSTRLSIAQGLLLVVLLLLSASSIRDANAQDLSSPLIVPSTSSSNLPTPPLGPIGDNAHCNIEDLEVANDSQLHTILEDLIQTSFFKNFVVDLQTSCPLLTWNPNSKHREEAPHETAKEEETSAPPDKQQGSDHGGEDDKSEECSSPFAAAELDVGAEPLCTIDTSDSDENALFSTATTATTTTTTTTTATKASSTTASTTTTSKTPMTSLASNALNHLAQLGGFQSQAQKNTFAWKKHSDLVVQPVPQKSSSPEADDDEAAADEYCEGNSFDSFWMDMCASSSPTSSPSAAKTVNLRLNPERNTAYNGTHIWRAIYEENCLAAGDMCLEERVLYRMLSGLHTSTTLSIAYNYYPPNKSKNRTSYEPNPSYFMDRFEKHPDRLRNLHFAYVVLLRAVKKATPFLKQYDIRTGNIVEDETATVLLSRLLDSAVLKSCGPVFDAFDESLLWKSKDIKVRQDFKGVFRNVSSILDCVQCQQCKLHGKLTMLGYGAALKVLFMQQPVLERNEVVALINTIAKFSESLRHIRELTNLYWRSKNGGDTVAAATSTTAATTPLLSSSSPSGPLPTALASPEWVDRAVQAVAGLGRQGRVDWNREAELVQLALERNEPLLILAKHYGADADKFLELTSRLVSGDVAVQAVSAVPDAIIVGSGLAGLAAALNMLDRGGTVLIIEKEHLLGGNSNKASSGINGCCLPDEVTVTNDTLDTFRNDTTRSAGASAQPALIETLVSRSGTAVTWLKSRVGVDLSLLSQLGGHSTKRTHRPSNGMAGAEIIYHLSKAVRAYESTGRVQIVVDAKVTNLVTTDDGRVVGVNVQFRKNESTAEFRADNVVLATGGFAADRSSGSYLEQYRPELLNMPATAGAFSTGDGVTLATALGAGTVDMDKVQIHPTGWVDPSDPQNPSKILAAELMRGVGGILVNDQGQRFCNELGTRAYVVNRMLSHDPTYARTKTWDPNATIPTFHLILSSSAAADGKKHVDLYTHKGLMTQVAGLSALAQHTGLPKQALLRTFQQYQSDAARGSDEFGKSSFRGIPQSDLESEIFYTGKIIPVLHYCMGGITIDTEGNVLKENGDKIPGLHAAGEVTGGVHGANRLGGNSLLECTVYGTIIGKKLPIKATTSSPTVAASKRQEGPSPTKSELRTVTMEELRKHNSPEDCWVSIHGTVYDLTAFAEEHPAGPASIHDLAGKDGTDAFAAVHGKIILEDFADDRIGRLIIA